jgi:hypothetical protein
MRRASRLPKISYYTAPYLTAPLPSLSFVRSCFHHSSLLFSRSTRYFHTIPSIPRSCNNVLTTTTTTSLSTQHTYITYSLAGPKLKIRRHIFFYFWLTTAQTQNTWALAPWAIFGVLHLAPITFYFFGKRGPFPLLPIFKAAPPRSHAVGVHAAGAWGFHYNFFLGPRHLHNVLGRPPKLKINSIVFLAAALTCKIW